MSAAGWAWSPEDIGIGGPPTVDFPAGGGRRSDRVPTIRANGLDIAYDVHGLPHSYNVATAAAMALYEFCRQYPRG